MKKVLLALLCAVLCIQPSFAGVLAEGEDTADVTEETNPEESDSGIAEEIDEAVTDETAGELAVTEVTEGSDETDGDVVILEEEEVPEDLTNASYPTIIPEKFVINATAGEIVSIVYNIFHEFKNERCVTEVYDSNGRLVANAEKDFYVYNTYKTRYTITWDTSDLPTGRYTVKSYMMFYSFYDWHTAPSSTTSYVDLGQWTPTPEPTVAPTPAPTQNPNYYWLESGGKLYWYEYGVKQGTYNDPAGVIGDGTVRGREIFDPASSAWYWLDSVFDGAKAEGKEVWMPYVYQDEASWKNDAAKMNEKVNASNSYTENGGPVSNMGEQVRKAILTGSGKWVRYDENGKMLKGWVTISGPLANAYPGQVGNTYFYDYLTGLMAKGWTTIGGQTYYFDETSGALR